MFSPHQSTNITLHKAPTPSHCEFPRNTSVELMLVTVQGQRTRSTLASLSRNKCIIAY